MTSPAEKNPLDDAARAVAAGRWKDAVEAYAALVELPAGEAPAEEDSIGDLEIDTATSLSELSLAEIVPGAHPLDGIEATEIPVAGTPVRDARAILPQTPLFSALDDRRLRMLIQRVRLVRLGSGEILFNEGDEADALYVVAQGEVAVWVKGKADAAVEVARLGEGSFFGEIALVTRQPRNATVMATTDAQLLAVDRTAALALVHGSPETLKIVLRFLRDRLVDTLVDTSPLFASLRGEERRALAARFRFLEIEPGYTVIHQGVRTPGLFVLLAGHAQVLLDGSPIAGLWPGDVFGEISLLGGGPAMASVRADTKSFALELPRADFQALILGEPRILELLGHIADERRARLETIRAGKLAEAAAAQAAGPEAPAGDAPPATEGDDVWAEEHLPII